eukprot:TRINITY_DN107987_c0_g1_i1.p1 TRINITY_DN107987_c0_g1~~TRINITY_DN107987_c0_g1_i1.p1  ORF type:complete len:358 (-),score=44.64 TRINITY_DN107987_c0_g1_i1:30-1013(-)
MQAISMPMSFADQLAHMTVESKYELVNGILDVFLLKCRDAAGAGGTSISWHSHHDQGVSRGNLGVIFEKIRRHRWEPDARRLLKANIEQLGLSQIEVNFQLQGRHDDHLHIVAHWPAWVPSAKKHSNIACDAPVLAGIAASAKDDMTQLVVDEFHAKCVNAAQRGGSHLSWCSKHDCSSPVREVVADIGQQGWTSEAKTMVKGKIEKLGFRGVGVSLQSRECLGEGYVHIVADWKDMVDCIRSHISPSVSGSAQPKQESSLPLGGIRHENKYSKVSPLRCTFPPRKYGLSTEDVVGENDDDWLLPHDLQKQYPDFFGPSVNQYQHDV